MGEMFKEWCERKYREWREMDAIFRYLMIGIVAVFAPLIVYAHFRQLPQRSVVASLQGARAGQATAGNGPQGASPVTTGFTERVLPDSPRNQGLEVVLARLDAIDSKQQKMQAQINASSGQASKTPGGPGFGGGPGHPSPVATTAATSNAAAASPLGKDLPEAVSFDQPGNGAVKAVTSMPDTAAGASAVAADEVAPPQPPARPMMVADPIDKSVSDDGDGKRPDLVLPIYTGFEAVMLSGVNARPSGSNSGAGGSVTAALDVGAPFVTRVKGVAIMPNSWKASDFENCFIGGSATAVLSAERAYAIADHISCIFRNGDVYEGELKAYALDVDGTLGLAGKVVNKQGAMLMQAALTGTASGLGAALAPSAVPSYNTNTGSGSEQSFTVPSPAFLAGTAVGQGVNHAATELSQFYLNFAKETFPVVEVTAGTRVTWILEKDIVLKKRTVAKDPDA